MGKNKGKRSHTKHVFVQKKYRDALFRRIFNEKSVLPATSILWSERSGLAEGKSERARRSRPASKRALPKTAPTCH